MLLFKQSVQYDYDRLPAYCESVAGPESAHLPRGHDKLSDLRRAQAPLSIVHTDNALRGNYLVDLSSADMAPDALFSSTNGSVEVTVAFEGKVPRRAVVEVGTTNAAVQLVVPEKQDGQPLGIFARSNNGSVHVGLPYAFDGVLTLSSTNGALMLSSALQRNSTLLSSTYTQYVWSNSTVRRYRIRPDHHHYPLSTADIDMGSIVAVQQDQNTGEDLAEVETTNERIEVGYGTEALSLDAYTRQDGRECCLIA